MKKRNYSYLKQRSYSYSYSYYIKLAGLGLIAGILGGLLGIGGGSLIVPGLVFLVGLNQHKAHGTSLVSALMLALSGVITYAIYGNINWLLAVEIAIGGIVGAIFGARATAAVKGRTLRLFFCIFLVIVGLRMVASGIQDSSGALPAACRLISEDHSALLAILVFGVGLVTGFLSALLGIGGGMVMVPAMVVLLCIKQHTAQGVSLAAMIPTALSGIIAHRKLGNVDFSIGKWVGISAAIGSILGSLFAANLDDTILKLAFGSFLAIMAIAMGLKK